MALNGGNQGNQGVGIMQRAASERATSNIPIDQFRHGVDSFSEWIGMFEDAVDLATGATTLQRRVELYKKWLPLKLDEETRSAYRSCTQNEWEELKLELQGRIRDPQTRYKWRSGETCISWDGRESMSSYAARVKRLVDENKDNPTESDYFTVFRRGLPSDFRDTIDMGIREERNETLAEARRVAERFLLVKTGRSEGEGKSVAFTGAAMDDDRLKSLEMSMKSLAVSVENGVAEMRKTTNRLDTLETWSQKVDRHMAAPPGPPPNYGYAYPNNYYPPGGAGYSGGQNNNNHYNNGGQSSQRGQSPRSNNRGQSQPWSNSNSPSRGNQGGSGYSNHNSRSYNSPNRNSGQRSGPNRSPSPGRTHSGGQQNSQGQNRSQSNNNGGNSNSNNNNRRGRFNMADLREHLDELRQLIDEGELAEN